MLRKSALHKHYFNIDEVGLTWAPWIMYYGLRGAKADISTILVKNHFFILLHKFIILNLIYEFLKFESSIAEVKSFIMPHVKFCAIYIQYLIRVVFYSIFLNFHFLSILTDSKCKRFYNFQAIKLKFFLHVQQSMFNKTCNSFFLYFSYFRK